ncbi:MAG: hypothetical protein ABSG68_15105 [Thermoguttaceae bacterium]
MASHSNQSLLAAATEVRAPAVHVHISPRMMMSLGALLVVPWLVVGALLAESRFRFLEGLTRPAPSTAVPGKPGPWGQLEYRAIRIEPPDEFVFVPPPDYPAVRWFFKGYSKEKALEFLTSAGLTAAQIEAVQKAEWKSGPEGSGFAPNDKLILALTPESRATIYSLLVEFPENARQIDPVWFREGQVDDRLKDSGLSSDSLALLKRLLYRQGTDELLFADFVPAVRQLPNDEERHRFMKAVARKRTLLAGLAIKEDSNIESIINYWSMGGRKKDVSPLLNALRREGPAKINIICLLPNFIRERLYTYPFPRDKAEVNQDCFWSALNLFNDPPDNRVNDMAYVQQLLKTDYYGIQEPSQLGDVVFLATQNDTVVHAASYIADDIVFTKNGEAYSQPWLLMHMNDMLDTYAAHYPASGPLKVHFFRKKSL